MTSPLVSDETLALLPCPFCGSTKAMPFPRTCNQTTPYDPADRAYPVVRCHGCFVEVAGKDWSQIDTAIAAWNTRTSDTLSQRVVELKALVARAEKFANSASGFDWNEDRCIMAAIHLAGDCRAALSKGQDQ